MGRSNAEDRLADALDAIGLPFRTEYNIKKPEYKRARRVDFFLHEHGVFIEVDGIQHFEDIAGRRTSKLARDNDVEKMSTALENHPNAVFVRVRSDDILSEDPSVDFLGIIRGLALARAPVDSGIVVFAESEGSTHYTPLKEVMGEQHRWVSAQRTRWFAAGSAYEHINLTLTTFDPSPPIGTRITDFFLNRSE